MPSYPSASQKAAQQAAAELAINDGDVPFYKSQPISRFSLGDDDEAVLAAAGPVRPRERSATFHTALSLSASAVTSTGGPVSAAEKEASWHEARPGNSPLANGNLSCLASSHNTRNGRVSGPQGGTPRSHGASLNLSSSQRHIERMSLPRDPQGVPFEPPQPNYGPVLNFTEEEERDRQQQAKSPRAPRTTLPPRLAGKPRSFSSTAVAHGSATEKAAAAPSKPRPLSAAQQARLEKLAAPRKYPSPAEAAPEPVPHSRSTTTNGSGAGSSGGIFDRLYASRKQTSSPPPEERRPSTSSFPPPLPLPRPRSGGSHTPVTTPSTQPPAVLFQRLAQPKNAPPVHKDASGLVEYNPYAPVKRYYGGTTVISAPPTLSAAAAGGGPSPTSNVAGSDDSRPAKVSWDMVDRHALPRSQQALGASQKSVCVECGQHPPTEQTVEVAAQLLSGSPNHASAAQPLAPRPVIVARPVTAAPAATSTASTGLVDSSSATPASTPTVVQSSPAKSSGTKPPTVVRTRRFVPPTEEEAAAAVAAPQPVEATRRRSTPLSAHRDAFPENSAPAAAAAAAVDTQVCAPAEAAPRSSAAPTPSPTHKVVQVVKRGPRRAPSPLAPAAAPETTPVTLTPAMPAAVVSSSSPPSSSSAAPPAGEVEGIANGAGEERKESAAAEAEDSKKEGEQPSRVAPPTPKSATSPKARGGELVYERLAPPPIPLDKLKTHRHSHKKKCVRPPKPEILKDEDFACRLEDFSPEPRRPVVIKKTKPQAASKKAAATPKH
ncbi:hypothetical protein ABB37_04839 [Leptomonas pyrrhocoris]|uniref:Uncharacterized protein n=1 Tax=Leptomonas pyrrhocoris TaxID=157538 RepID=A0A0N0VFB1_LEPPY|nr:hypothetical protein ABB37_04839 [Leptomonas pyrrhocoris]KPA80652.1 hypothetical protein ABB37_04839 [Leptomonas pyrrhocoris]|eukprot:XP_015659091.1 hypothetical protein ABB37_04839 [Leptomonas pyrrhocoris]